jgi:multiple sugar transport system permease protein
MTDGALATARTAPRRHRGLESSQTMTAWLFLLPSLLGVLLFLILPIGFSLAMSFTDWRLIGVPSFVGFTNYIKLFTSDRQFWPIVANTLLFTIEYLALNLIISVGLAVWICSLKVGKTWARVVFFLPTFTPPIAVSIVWLLILTPDGLLDFVLKSIGIDPLNILSDPKLAMQAVVVVALWSGVGYNTVLFNAALDLVPPSYLEAARIDGATAWHRFWKIRLPLISPTLFFAAILTIITSLQVFDQIFVMTKGGPGSSTVTFGFAIYQKGLENFQMGYASAIAWVMFALIMAITALQFWLQKKWVHYDH